MGAFATGLRNTVAKIKSLVKSGAHYLHITDGITAVDALSKLAGQAKTALTDYEPLVDEMPISAAAKTEIKALIGKYMPLITTSANVTPAVYDAIKTALAGEIVAIVTKAVSGQVIEVSAIEVDIKNIFAAEGIVIPAA